MRGRFLAVGALIALVVAFAPSVPAVADVEEPLVTTYAWYWEPQTQRSVTDPTSGADVITAGPGNAHFCPGVEGVANPEQACKPGRLPVEVAGGDYETPDKISATAFDLSIAPMGSQVNRFTVTYLEANDEQSQPYNAEGKRLQACLINKIFGGGEARQYKEAPKYTCPKEPILGTRSKVKRAGSTPTEERFQWVFDLTTPAQKWVKEGSFATGIMLLPLEPKNPGPGDANWRIVLQGSEDLKGVQTRLDFVPAKLPNPLGGIGSGKGSGGDVGSAGADLGGGDLGSTSAGVSDSTAPEVTASEAEPVQAEEARSDLASDAIPAVPGGLPGYVWLGLLAGVLGLSAVRSVVFEGSSGLRPNGVLAQIHKLNRQRNGDPDSATTIEGPLAPVLEGLSSLRAGASRLAAKLPRIRRG
ncbi:MAG: hypothetical protein ACRDJT_04540 [Actinomycetota bacterium]